MVRISMYLMLVLMYAVLAMAQPATWMARGRGGGGGQFNPVFSPHNPDELYVGCDMGEYFHTVDGGAHWDIVPFQQLTSNDYTAVRFTSDPLILYALDSEYDARPVKSTDGGATWTPTYNPMGQNRSAYAIHTDPHRSDRLLLSGNSTLYLSQDGGQSFTPAWTESDNRIAGVFFDNDTIYVGTNWRLLRSQDGGNSFSNYVIDGLPGAHGMASFSGAREGETVRFVCTVAGWQDIYIGVTGSSYDVVDGVYTYTLGDAGWIDRTAALPAGALPFFTGMAANEADIMYLAGTNDPYYHPSVFKSTDGGASWSAVLNTLNNANVETGWCGWSGDEGWGWGGNALGFGVALNDANRLAITDYGFTHLSFDGGASWRAAYVAPEDLNPSGHNTPDYAAYHSNGLEPTSVWYLEWMDADHLFASFTDIESAVSDDGGVTWAKANLDPGGYNVNTVYRTVLHPTGLLYAATSSIHDLYQSTYLTDSRIDGGDGQIFISADNGHNFTLVHDFNHPVVWIDLDPNNPERMLASVVHSTQGDLYLTENLSAGLASTWTRLATPPRTEGHPYLAYFLNDGSLVCTYSGRRTSVFTQSSGVFYSTDNGQTWSDRSDPMMIYWTKDIVIDPHDPAQNTWFTAVHRGWGGPPNSLGGLFKTTDRGLSWTRICDLLYAESCTVHPDDADICYVATETDGLWYTENLRDPTPDWTLVESYPFMHPLRVFFNPFDANDVWMTSFGNGMKVGYADQLSAPQALTIIRNGEQLELRWLPVIGAAQYTLWSSTSDAPDVFNSTVITTTGDTSVSMSVPEEPYRTYFVTAE